ncbi:methyltransferase RsmF C-terminal domain-like protein [Candidatus Korarchaeum cryptofilum]|uniref:methyltransferase RsmF C-terminal domain-like protein n=1 Tax=Candidatus Korarchaeum cryptofilum TaxID=498846 RepID=UPI00163C4CB1|nr:hypothetical protein [Candidatus Korarchaeum cryptofilum]
MKEFLEWVKDWFGSEISGVELFPSGKDKIRACSPEAKVEISNVFLRGVYVAKRAPYGFIISIEGSFIIGRSAKRHLVDLSESDFRRWMRGDDIELKLPEKGVYIVRYGEAFAGSGYYDGRVLRNLIPKVRTLEREG